MKTTSRILSMVLALVMVFSLSVTAFADSAPTVIVKNGSETIATITDLAVGDSVADALTDYAEENHIQYKWKPVKDYYDPSVTHQALDSFDNKATRGINKDSTEDMAKAVAGLEKLHYTAEEIAKVVWLTGANAGYGLIKTGVNDEGKTVYTYAYAGYAWTYTDANNSEIWDYMCHYFLKDGEVITVSYDFNLTVFDTTNRIG